MADVITLKRTLNTRITEPPALSDRPTLEARSLNALIRTYLIRLGSTLQETHTTFTDP